MRYAVVDTGSNTIRMSIYECENDSLKEIYTEAVFANLAGHIIDNELTDTGIDVCCEAIEKHKKTAKEYDADLHVFATAAIRNANNTQKIVNEVAKNTGVNLEILSGTDEGELSFLGAFDDFPTDEGIMADVGGGSSEIIAFEKGKIIALQSIPLGSLKAYKTFVDGNIPTVVEIENIRAEIKKHLNKNEQFKNIKTENLCLVGGGVLASQKISKAFFNKADLTISGVNTMMSLFMTSDDTEKILDTIVPKRKLTIIPGLAIYSAIGKYFGAETIHISDKGIKEGYTKKYLLH